MNNYIEKIIPNMNTMHDFVMLYSKTIPKGDKTIITVVYQFMLGEKPTKILLLTHIYFLQKALKKNKNIANIIKITYILYNNFNIKIINKKPTLVLLLVLNRL